MHAILMRLEIGCKDEDGDEDVTTSQVGCTFQDETVMGREGLVWWAGGRRKQTVKGIRRV